MIDLFDSMDRKRIAAFIESEHERIEYNANIQQILDGDMLGLLEKKMMDDLGQKSFSAARTRKAPINIYRKVVDKLTTIYDQPVIRTVEGGTEADKKLLAWYEDILKINVKFSKNNFKFNAFQYALLQIGLKDPKPGIKTQTPFVRTIPNHQFLVMNDSSVDPSSDDVIILCMEPRKIMTYRNNRYFEETQEVYYVWTDYQFAIIDQRGDLILDRLYALELNGVNPFGVTPFAYSNSTDDCAMPAVQSDNLDMSLLVALLLTDLNYAVKYQAFSLFVAINIDEKKIELSPNSILSFQTPPGDERQPSFTSIKPTVDISETLSLTSSEMSLWISTKGIRPGTVGQVSNQDQFASGLSKMIDESDTFEALKKQITVYLQTENIFWDKLLKHIHPRWVNAGRVENRQLFSVDARVVTKLMTPVPMQTRTEKIAELKQEKDAGFTTRRRAIRALNPNMSEAEVDQLVEEIISEASENAKRFQQNQPKVEPDVEESEEQVEAEEENGQ